MNYLMTLLASAIGSCALGTPDGEVPVLTPEVFIETARADSTAFILDVRRPGEFAEGHLEGAQLLDWLNQPAFIEGIKHFDKKRTYYLYCVVGSEAMLPLPICRPRASVCAIWRAAICAGRLRVAP